MQRFDRRTLLGLLPLLPLAACAGLPENLESPEVQLADLRFREAGLLLQRLELDLLVRNPNRAGLPLDGLRAELVSGGERLLVGQSRRSVTIPGLGERIVTLEATTSTFELVRRLQQLARDPRGFDYELRGIAYVGRAGSLRELPFVHHASVMI